MKNVTSVINAKKIKKIVLPNLPYAFLFWFFNKVGEAVRLAPGKDILHKFIGGVGKLNIVFGKPPPSLDPFDLCVGLFGAAAVFCAVLYRKHHTKKWRKEVLCYKGRQWIIAEKPCSHGVCGTNGRTGNLA